MAEETQAAEAQSAENTTAENSSSNSVELPVIYGQKAGMTRIFDEVGNHVPVTVVKLIPNFVSQVKTPERDGYEAYQIAYGEKREKLVKKPMKGHLKKAKLDENLSRFAEIRISGVDESAVGKQVSVDEAIKPSSYVDITGLSKGKGFQGVVKRYGFSGGCETHGSKLHRATGSIGNAATPSKVFKGKKLPGHMGDERKTIQNLKVLEVNKDKGYMLIKGSIPGSKNGFVRVSKAVKKQ